MEKPFLEHLEDLRKMFFKMIFALALGILACLALTRPLMDAIRLPMVWANVAEEDAIKAVFNFQHKASRPRFATGDLVVTQGGNLGTVVKEDMAKGITWVEVAPGVQMRYKTNTIEGKIPTEESKVAPEDLQRLSKQNILIMETFAPGEGLMIVLKLAFFSALVISFPMLLWFLLEFVWPGLKQVEKKALLPALVIGFALFIIGAAFAFRLGLPFALRWLSQWNYEHGINPGWRVGYYIQFVTQVTLVFGLMFEFPVVIMALVYLEILSYQTMKHTRSYAIMILLVVAGFVTPPDPITLPLLTGPLILLYEMCIWLAYFMERKRAKQRAEEEKREAAERAAREEERAKAVAEGRLLPEAPSTTSSESASSGTDGPGSSASSPFEGDPYRDSPESGGYNYEGEGYSYEDPGQSVSNETPAPQNGGSGIPQLIDINNATLEELQQLPGIGPKLAQQIVEARPFYSEEELEYHAYLPPSVIKLIRDRVTFL